jgi:hypothetical protein
MNRPYLPRAALLPLVLLSLGGAGRAAADDGAPHYQSKTPYQPQQSIASYEAPPPGYHAVYTQMLARHGSRGLTGMKSDLALYNLWLAAKKEGGLTTLGAGLGPDIWKLMRANFLLGYGVEGIGKPGYGNETMQGIAEHTGLAQRLLQRLPALFSSAAEKSTSASKGRSIVVITSGKDRAVDSGYFFVRSLIAQQAGLAPLVQYPASLAPRAEQNHLSRAAGTDRYLLYFHKLGARQDKVADPADPLFRTYQASQAYQAYAASPALRDKEEAILAQPRLAGAANTVLERLFKPAFIAGLQQGRYRFANSGDFSFTSADGKFTNALSGDGEETIATPVDAALKLYDIYSAAADMRAEVPADFTPYLPSAQAAVFAEVNDAISFYTKGPAGTDNGDVTVGMARLLLDDFFAEVDAVAAGDMSHLAKLRFAHAETVIPMAAILGIPGMAQQQPPNQPYDHANNPWRGEIVAPMAANIQWDVYADDKGGTLVRMLYNERETGFKRACDGARLAPGSYFYVYSRLKTCYLGAAAEVSPATSP